MMTKDYEGYLSLLRGLIHTLAQLTETAQSKVAAVRQDDLAALDECMKREQAFSMSLRGYEQKRRVALAALGIEGVSLSGLASHYPAELQREAKTVSEELFRQYQIYSSTAEVARTTLECNLHEIEKFLAHDDKHLSEGMGYPPPSPEPPTGLKTDFRA